MSELLVNILVSYLISSNQTDFIVTWHLNLYLKGENLIDQPI